MRTGCKIYSVLMYFHHTITSTILNLYIILKDLFFRYNTLFMHYIHILIIHYYT